MFRLFLVSFIIFHKSFTISQPLHLSLLINLKMNLHFYFYLYVKAVYIDVEDRLCLWQVWNVGDRFSHWKIANRKILPPTPFLILTFFRYIVFSPVTALCNLLLWISNFYISDIISLISRNFWNLSYFKNATFSCIRSFSSVIFYLVFKSFFQMKLKKGCKFLSIYQLKMNRSFQYFPLCLILLWAWNFWKNTLNTHLNTMRVFVGHMVDKLFQI